jgi:acyl-CoA thioester hydrolase
MSVNLRDAVLAIEKTGGLRYNIEKADKSGVFVERFMKIFMEKGSRDMANEIQLKGVTEPLEITPYVHHTRYAEAGPQGIIHHSHYLNWMEAARMDLMEQIGLGYQQMEALEIMSPTLSETVEYRSAVKFDDTVVIDTKLSFFDGHKMEVAYRIYDKKTGEDRAVAKSTHCFVNRSGVPISLKRIYPELETKFFEFK